MKKILMAVAVLSYMMMMAVVTACSESDDPQTPSEVINNNTFSGSWIGEVTGNTYAIWNYGEAWNKLTFHTDGTGISDIYYTFEEQPVAHEQHSFTYTLTADKLTLTVADDKKNYVYKLSDNKLVKDNLVYYKGDAKTDSMIAQWNQIEMHAVPAPARYTVFVYGISGGKKDKIIEEGFWDVVKPYLTDSTNVRVVCLHKYGKNTNSKYANDGDVVWFELNSKTDLTKIRENGIKALGYDVKAMSLKLYDPSMLRVFMEMSSLMCPAQDYILTIWGHGNGFEPMYDKPGKFATTATRGVIADEWNSREQLDMYELAEAIRSTGVGRLNTIFFHNCLMGNMETLTEVRDVAEYLVASAHVLSDSQGMLAAFVHSLQQTGNVNEAMKLMFQTIRPAWDETYPNDSDHLLSGDLKLISCDALGNVIDATKLLADRLVALYPTQREAIDRATTKVYRYYLAVDDPNYNYYTPFFDLADYAHKLAEETGDAGFATIASDIDKAFSEAILQYADVNFAVQRLNHYTLSVCLFNQLFYDFDFIGAGLPWNCNIGEGYKQSTFHKLTGWGNWCHTNQKLPWGNPTSGGGGQLNK